MRTLFKAVILTLILTSIWCQAVEYSLLQERHMTNIGDPFTGIASGSDGILLTTDTSLHRTDTFFYENEGSSTNGGTEHYVYLTWNGNSYLSYNDNRNTIVKFSGSIPYTLTETAYFYPPENTIIGLASDRQGRLFILGGDTGKLYIVQEEKCFQERKIDGNIEATYSNIPVTLSDIRGVAYDGAYLWIMADSPTTALFKYDLISETVIASYSTALYIDSDAADLAYDNEDLLLTGFESGYQRIVRINTAPPPVEIISFEDLGTGGSARLSWKESTDTDITGYHILYGSDPSLLTEKAFVSGYPGSYDISGAENFRTLWAAVIPEDSLSAAMTNNINLASSGHFMASVMPTQPRSTVYVSTAGSALYPYSSPASAATNLNQALSAASNGSCIQILSDLEIYESVQVNVPGLLFQGDHADPPVLNAYASNTVIVLSNHSVFQDLKFHNKRNSGANLVSLNTSPILLNEFTFINCTFEGNGGQYSLLGTAVSAADLYKLTMDQCQFLNLHTGLDLSSTANLEVSSCVFNNVYSSINPGNSTGTIRIHDNKFTGFGICINKYSFQNQNSLLIYRNLFKSSSEGMGDAHAINLEDIRYGELKIFNNIFTESRSSLFYFSYAFDCQTGLSANIFNNIFFRNEIWEMAILNNYSSLEPTFRFYNNATDEHMDATDEHMEPQQFRVDSGNINFSIPNNNLSGNPLFTDFESGDYTLRRISALIDAGGPNGLDYLGSAPDIGIYETLSYYDFFSPISEEEINKRDYIYIDSYTFSEGETISILAKNLQYFFDTQARPELDSEDSDDTTISHLEVNIYSLKGKKVRTLFNNDTPENAILFHWDGRNEAGELLSPGVYVIRFTSLRFDFTEKVIFIR